MLPLDTSIKKVVLEPTPDPHEIKQKAFAYYRCKVIVQLVKDGRVKQNIKDLVYTGATSSIASGWLFENDELEESLIPIIWAEQKICFSVNKFAITKFKVLEFTENTTIIFPIYVDTNNSIDSPCNFVLGLDAIIELCITINR